jgi:hypothetical protein
MTLRISDPLFLLSAQTGLSARELSAKAAQGNPDVDRPQTALKTGEPIPIIFCRRRSSNGGVMVQPKMTEGSFGNPIVEEEYTHDNGNTFENYPVQTVQIKYLLILSEGELPLIQIRDVFHGNCRRGTMNQKYNGRAGTWTPGNYIDDDFDYVLEKTVNNRYNFSFSQLSNGQTARLGTLVYHRNQDGVLFTKLPYVEHSFPIFCGTSGSYSGLTTLSFEYQQLDAASDKIDRTVSVFVRRGLQVTRLIDNATGSSDNFVDLAKYLFQASDRLADDLIDNSALSVAANFVDTNSFFFNGAIIDSENLLDWLQKTSVNFLLQVSSSNGKFGLRPRLPYNTDYTIKTTKVAPEYTFTEEHIVEDGFEIEYISLEDREPSCFVVQWRQQPEADFGLVRTVEVRYQGEATDGPYINVDMSNYCTNEDHAVKVGAFRLAQRKFITHHLRLTVREKSYNSLLVVGDIVRVRLRRETDEGQVEYHDKLYEINRIEKDFSSEIVYDLTHFPVDSEGRSIVARQVAAASGAGNTINVGRGTFDCDENDPDATTTVGTGFGGGGTAPGTIDTAIDVTVPLNPDGSTSSDTPFPGDSTYNQAANWNNPDDPIDAPEPQRTISGYSGTPGTGDTLTFSPGCANPLIKWYKININTNDVTFIGSGISATLEVTEALQTEGVRVYAEGCCPDPSQPGGYAVCKKSDEVDVFDEIIDCPGGGDAGNQGTFTKVINVGTAFPASFNFRYTAFTIQDRFVISGAASLDTGFVSGTNVNVTVQKTSADPYITVTVFAPTSGTAWNYDVGCAS